MANADFTVLEPEDLVAASAYNEYNVLVTNELRLFPDGNEQSKSSNLSKSYLCSIVVVAFVEKQRYEMVVLVHKDVRNIWDVKSKIFCHPGLDTTDDWTNAFSTVNFFAIIKTINDQTSSRKFKKIPVLITVLRKVGNTEAMRSGEDVDGEPNDRTVWFLRRGVYRWSLDRGLCVR